MHVSLKRHEAAREIRRLAALCNDESHEWTDDNEKEWKRANKKYDAAKMEDEITKMDPHKKGRGMIGRPDAIGGSGAGINHPETTAFDESDDLFGGDDWDFLRDEHSGRNVPLLQKRHSMKKYVSRNLGREEITERYGRLSLGDTLRALAVGANTEQERRALGEGLDSAGGYTVPTILSGEMIDLVRTKSRVFQAAAAAISLDSNKHHFAKLVSDPVPAWREENGPVTSPVPSFGRIEFAAKSLAVLVRVSEELIQDSVNAADALQKSISQALALEVDRAALFGSGSSNEPLGLDGFAGVNVIDMGANGGAITDYTPVLDSVLAMQESNGGNVTSAIMAPRTLRSFNGLVDTTGQPLHRPGSISQVPFLETTQVPIDQTHGTATDASTVFLGNFQDLVIGFRQRLRIEVMRQTFRANLQVGFIAHLRVDVQAWHEESFAKITGITP